MSKKTRHVTYVIVSFLIMILFIFVTLKFFTNDKNSTTLANLEEDTYSDKDFEIVVVTALQENLSSSEDTEQDDIENTNDIERNSIDNNSKEVASIKTTSRSSVERTSFKTEQPSTSVTESDEDDEEISEEPEPEPAPVNSNALGTISIPKTGVNLPILKSVTVSGMESAVCYLYSTGSLNKSGTTIIVGHNYRNGKLFSNNKNLQIGDSIYITTSDGNKVQYTVYEKITTDDEDLSYLDRNTTGEAQIALSTCADNDIDRLVILAK